MKAYTPNLTPTFIIKRVAVVDFDTIQVWGAIPLSDPEIIVDLEGPNLGSTYGMCCRNGGGPKQPVFDVLPVGDGSLVMQCTGVQPGWTFYASIGCESLISANGWRCAGTVKKIADDS